MQIPHDGGAAGAVLCPFAKTPSHECYCSEMNGRKVHLAMRFCLKDYKSCRIYRKRFLQEAGRSDDAGGQAKGGGNA